MALNFATVFATSCLTLSMAIPGALYVAGEFAGQRGGGAPRATTQAEAGLWVQSPAFVLSDGKGGKVRVIAAIAAANEQESDRICRYLPIVRDRLQRFAASVRVVGSEGGQPTLRGDKKSLSASLAKALALPKAPDVKIIEARYPVVQVLYTKPRQCDQGTAA